MPRSPLLPCCHTTLPLRDWVPCRCRRASSGSPSSFAEFTCIDRCRVWCYKVAVSHRWFNNVTLSATIIVFGCVHSYPNIVGVSGQLLHKLQVIQNAAARIITGTKRCERMTQVLRELHWLPVRERITYKTALLVYKCIHDLAPYLAAFCQPTSCSTGRSHLRSAGLHLLHVPRTRTSYGDRSFSVNGSAVWNSLPVDLRSPDISLDIFKQRLKTFLFSTVH